MNVLLALSLNLVMGYTGQLNLGQSAFFAIGAYVSTILIKTYGWNFWLAALVAVAAAGLPRPRARGLRRAPARPLPRHRLAGLRRHHLPGADQLGERDPGRARHLRHPAAGAATPSALFYLVAGIAVAVYLLLDNLVRSPVGDTLRAIREDEISAASLGVNAAIWKAFAFGLGAAIAGLAGVFYPGFVGTLVPDAFGIIESFTMMAMVIVGGMGTMIGPVIGAVVLTFLPELLRGFGELRLHDLRRSRSRWSCSSCRAASSRPGCGSDERSAQ